MQPDTSKWRSDVSAESCHSPATGSSLVQRPMDTETIDMLVCTKIMRQSKAVYKRLHVLMPHICLPPPAVVNVTHVLPACPYLKAASALCSGCDSVAEQQQNHFNLYWTDHRQYMQPENMLLTLAQNRLSRMMFRV